MAHTALQRLLARWLVQFGHSVTSSEHFAFSVPISHLYP